MIIFTGPEWAIIGEGKNDAFKLRNSSDPEFGSYVIQCVQSIVKHGYNAEPYSPYDYLRDMFFTYFPHLGVIKGYEYADVSKAATIPGKGPDRFDKGDKRGGQFRPKDDNSLQPVTPQQKVAGINARITEYVSAQIARNGSDPARVEADAQMYQDVMSMDLPTFIHYGRTLGIPDNELKGMGADYFAANQEVSREQAQAKWDKELGNTLHLDGKPVFDAYTAQTQKIDSLLYGDKAKIPTDPQIAIKGVTKHNPSVRVMVEKPVSEERLARDLWTLGKVLDEHPAAARVFAEKCKRIAYGDDARSSADMSWEDPGTLRIWGAGQSDKINPSSVFLHELGHAAESYFVQAGSPVSTLFPSRWDQESKGRVSKAAWQNPNESFAEFFVMAQNDAARDALEEFAPEITEQFDKVMPWLRNGARDGGDKA